MSEAWETAREVAGLAQVPLRILLVLVLALVLRHVLHRLVDRSVARSTAVRVPAPGALGQLVTEQDPDPIAAERRRQRAETVGSLLRSLVSLVVLGVTGAVVLSELGVDLGPVLASAGVVGVALGFGAQNLVKDWLNGVALILEDQFGVGDVVDTGLATGVVEEVGLRVTRLRDVEGVVWYVRNGEVLRLGNKSSGWSRAVLDVPVAYRTDLAAAKDVVARVADAYWREQAEHGHESLVLEEPQVWGVEALGADGVVLRLVVTTRPLQQWAVGRALRERLHDALSEADIEIPFPQRTVWVRGEGGRLPGAQGPATEGASSAGAPGGSARRSPPG